MPESAAFSRRGHVGGAARTTLAGALGAGDATIAVASLSTWAGATSNGPARAVLDRGLASEEKIEFTAIAGNSLTGVTRGIDGTTAATHTTGAYVEHVLTARDLNEANQAVNAVLGGVGGITTANLANASVTAAKLAAAIPLGTLGYAQVVADGAPITTETDLPGLSVTVTVAAGRRILISGVGRWTGTQGQNQIAVRIKEGATQLQQSDSIIGTAGDAISWSVGVSITPTAGVHTYKLAMIRTVGSGTASTTATATAPSYLLVEDIGAA